MPNLIWLCWSVTHHTFWTKDKKNIYFPPPSRPHWTAAALRLGLNPDFSPKATTATHKADSGHSPRHTSLGKWSDCTLSPVLPRLCCTQLIFKQYFLSVDRPWQALPEVTWASKNALPWSSTASKNHMRTRHALENTCVGCWWMLAIHPKYCDVSPLICVSEVRHHCFACIQYKRVADFTDIPKQNRSASPRAGVSNSSRYGSVHVTASTWRSCSSGVGFIRFWLLRAYQ